MWLEDYAMMMPRLYKQRSLSAVASFHFFFMGVISCCCTNYLPVYSQSILGASTIGSGVDNLPLVIAASVFAIMGGAIVMMTGRAQLVMLVARSSRLSPSD